MRKTRFFAVALVLVGLMASVAVAQKGESSRLLTGKVVDQDNNPVQGAIVHLTNTRTQAIKTYITSQDGIFRFPALSPNVDYEVFALYKGHKSDTKTVSQFDNRPQMNLVLKIDLK